jgi:hypothetical protein
MAGQTPGTPVPTTPVATLPGQNPTTDLATLQSQLGEFRIQLKGLQAQWDGLHSQLDAMLRNNPARPGVQQQWADVGVQIAQVKGDIARLEARIAAKQGYPTTTQPPPPPRRSIDPNFALPISAVLFIVLAMPVSMAWARRLGRAKPAQTGFSPDHIMRLERMEHAIDVVAIEVERISEGQRFVTKILAERPADGPMSDAGARSAAAPPLALGAGPMEPIRAPERERVRQPIVTPH